MQSIVVAYDATDASRRALNRAAELTKAFGAQLTVTSVAPMMRSPRSSSVDPTDTPADRERMLAEAESYLAGRGVDAATVMATGNPEDAIVEVARERSADVIVMGTRGIGAFARLLGQSVSDAVANRAPCDVFIVREED